MDCVWEAFSSSSPEPATDLISGLLLENRFKHSLFLANRQHNSVL